jgi:hypothetical protein
MKRFIIIFIIIIASCDGTASFFWNTCEEKEDIRMEAYIAGLDSYMILTILKKILWSYFFAMEMFVRINIIYVIIVTIAAIGLLYVIKRILQGRHRNSECNKGKETKTNSSICVNISNSNNTRSKSGDDTTSNYTNAELKGIINKPEILTDKAYISVWMQKMEIYLETVDKRHWYKVAISFMDIKLVKEIHVDNTNNEDKYEALKNQLMKIADKQNFNGIQKKIDYKAIGERRQHENESIEEYGNSLISMGTEMFPHLQLESLDESLKSQFVDGIRNPNLSQEVKWKMIKQQRKNEKFNIRNAIEYAKDKDNAYNYDNCNDEDSLDDQNNDSNQIINDTNDNSDKKANTHSVCSIKSSNPYTESRSKAQSNDDFSNFRPNGSTTNYQSWNKAKTNGNGTASQQKGRQNEPKTINQ